MTRAHMPEKASKPKRPRPNRGEAIGIVNPYGDIWTHDWFDTPEDAQKHLGDFWRDIGTPNYGEGFRIVRVHVSVSYAGEIASAGNTTPAGSRHPVDADGEGEADLNPSSSLPSKLEQPE